MKHSNTKGSQISYKDRQYNRQKKKNDRTINDIQNKTTQKLETQRKIKQFAKLFFLIYASNGYESMGETCIHFYLSRGHEIAKSL
jgi:mannitol-specific phosphotransferase system IIBC component